MTLKGLYRKFCILRTDSRDLPGEKHYRCRYFVLDLDHDPHVWPALYSYAHECKDTHEQLSRDLREVVLARLHGNLEDALQVFDRKLGGDANA